MQNLVQKWRKLAPFLFRATAALRHYFLLLAPPRRVAPFSVCTSGAVALKVAQLTSTAFVSLETTWEWNGRLYTQ